MIFRYLIVSLLAMMVAAVGIDAVDNYDRISESIVGRWLSGGKEPLCPSDMVYVPSSSGGFCIDRYEASAGADCPASEPKSSADTVLDLDVPACRPESRPDALPWRFISQNQAAMACAKAGKRLPTGREWQAAALGTPDPSSGWGADDCQVALNWPEQPGRTGTGARCQSPAGAYDLIGNVWEWTSEVIQDGRTAERQLPLQGYVGEVSDDGWPTLTTDAPASEYSDDYLWIKTNEYRAAARGGYWDNQEKGGTYSAYIVLEPRTGGAGIGFRCVK